MDKLKSHKKQFFVIIALILLGFMLCYNLGFKRTLIAYQLYNEESIKLASSNDLPSTIETYKLELNSLDQIIGNNDTLNINTKQLLIEKTAKYCDSTGIIIKEVPKSISEKKNNFEVESVIIVIEGKFNKLLQYLYDFEQFKKIGKTSSVSFYVTKDFVTKREYLYLRTCTQFIKTNEVKN